MQDRLTKQNQQIQRAKVLLAIAFVLIAEVIRYLVLGHEPLL